MRVNHTSAPFPFVFVEKGCPLLSAQMDGPKMEAVFVLRDRRGR